MEEKILSGWSSYKHFDTKIFTPSNALELQKFIFKNKNQIKVIARGHGCSFGDQAICSKENGVTIDLSNIDQLVEYSEEEHILIVEGSMQLKNILKFLLPKNLTLNCIPGGLEITVGGAIANNVHGKDCWKNGYFEKNVKSIKILDSEGNFKKLSKNQNKEHFEMMFSSLGLLGIIVEVELFVKKIPSPLLEINTHKVKNLNEMQKLFENLSDDNDYAVAWLDCFAKNENSLRGIFQTAKFTEFNKNLNLKKKDFFQNPDQIKIFGFIPVKFIWKIVKIFFNTKIFKILNPIAFHFSSFIKKKKVIPYEEFMMLETKYLPSYKSWFEPDGFLCIQPFFSSENAFEKIKQVVELCQKFGVIPFWCPIKKYKKENVNPLDFNKNQNGYSIVIDFFPKEYKEDLIKLFIQELEELILQQNGKFYLSKDQIMSKEFFKKTYPEFKKFIEIKNKFDSNEFFLSEQYKRLFK